MHPMEQAESFSVQEEGGLVDVAIDERLDQRIRTSLTVVLAGVVSFVVIDSFTSHYIHALLVAFITWVKENPSLGVFAVIWVYILATVLFVPGSILTLGTGYAFGNAFESTAKAVAMASTAVFIGATLGSLCAFLLGRYLFRDCVQRMALRYKMFQAIDRALENNGLKIMILLRLSPLIPYTALDYLSGLTSISFWVYMLALVAILPGTIVFCFMGASASSITSGGDDGTTKTVSLVLGVMFALVGVLVASYYSKMELDKILADEAQSDTALLNPVDGQNALCDEELRRVV